MPILIQRKVGTNLTWEANAMFSMAFTAGQDVFEIPRLEYMLYLHKQFNLIQATDENGEDLDLTDICNCCRESVRLELVQKYQALKDEEDKEVKVENNVVIEDQKDRENLELEESEE
jgi:hypothetical protein